MNSIVETSLPLHRRFRLHRLLQGLTIAATVASVAGCGGVYQSSNTVSSGGGNTSVTVLVSSRANDQLAEYFLALNQVTLTTASGSTVDLFAAPQYLEFIHMNGKPEPLPAVSIPQGTYVSAAASVGSGNIYSYCYDPPSGDIVSSDFEDQFVPASGVRVNLQEPLTISGDATVLSLEMEVSQSASWITCGSNSGSQPFAITPTFDLGAADVLPGQTGATTVQVQGLRGLVTEVDSGGGGFTVQSANILLWFSAPAGPAWHFSLNGSETYQGISGVSQLVVGMPADVDALMQEDGSLRAEKIRVFDTHPSDLTVTTGPLARIWASGSIVSDLEVFAADPYAQGVLPATMGAAPFGFANSAFEISNQISNLQTLPFAASFTAANMVAGQNVFISTHLPAQSGFDKFLPATTMTLLPQTINGTVSAIGSEGSFTTYTVTLAPYDLFPALAVQAGQTTLLTNPNTVVVYADSNTQMLNTSPIAVGNVVRFYGLVFNDNGTLRMDCAQAMDGVAE